VLVVVLELLTANGADDVVKTRSWLLDVLWSLFTRSQFLRLLREVVIVLLVQEFDVLICKLPLLLELED